MWLLDGFLMLKFCNGCLDGFKEGSFVMGVFGVDYFEQYYLDIRFMDDELIVRFCLKEQMIGGDIEWEFGQYCILWIDWKCLNGKVLCNLMIRKFCQ